MKYGLGKAPFNFKVWTSSNVNPVSNKSFLLIVISNIGSNDGAVSLLEYTNITQASCLNFTF